MSTLPRSASGQFLPRDVAAKDSEEIGKGTEEDKGLPLDKDASEEGEHWEDDTSQKTNKYKERRQGRRSRQGTTGGRSNTSASNTASPKRTPANTIDPATFQNSMFQMMQMLTQSITTQNQQQRTSASPGVFGSKEPKVKDPETFNGQRDLLNAFITECTLIFELQPSRFPNDRTMIGYMVALLRGTALMAVRPHLVAEIRPVFLQSYVSFIDYLKTNFGDPDEKGTARRRIKGLRQTTSASAYFSEFQQYIAILGWMDQDPIIDKAIEGLKSTLKDELARHGKRPDTLTELIEFIIPLDNRLFEREQEKHREQGDKSGNGRRGQGSGNNTTTTPNSTSAQMFSTKLDETRPQQGTTVSQTTTPSTYRRTPGRLTDEVKQGRMDRGECLWCGIGGHLARECPDLRKRDQQRAELKAVRETEAKGEDEGSENGVNLSK
jgi:hypothetical protein